MLVDLKSIEEEGEQFQFTQSSEEMEGAFDDLIGSNEFKADIEIKPLGNTYQIHGSIESHYPELCSQCGHDIDVLLKNRINEIVVVEKQRPRNTQVSQSQQEFKDSGPAVTYINDHTLNLKEFLHEMMAAGIRPYPQCEDTGLCESRQYKAPYVKKPEEKTGHPGFASLKNFKVSKH
jgi:uncharacterized protein